MVAHLCIIRLMYCESPVSHMRACVSVRACVRVRARERALVFVRLRGMVRVYIVASEMSSRWDGLSWES